MNLKEAYSILELSQTATPEEAKKKYRELTKKYHPDVNKENGAEDKFKKINEAYQVVSSGKSTDRQDMHWQQPQSRQWSPFGQRQVMRQASNIEVSTTISFKDSVFGTKVEIKYQRGTKCQECDGSGEHVLNNGCQKCGGRGQITGRRGNMIFSQTCDKCYGRMQSEPCKTCNSEGVLEGEASVGVTIPGGIQDSQMLRLQGMGNFAGSFGPLEQYTDVYLRVKVTPEKGLTLQGSDVVSSLEVPLIDALRGCTKTVKTVLGDKEITIKPQSRNRDEVVIPHLGVNRIGNHKVILDVTYPKDVGKLIDVLI